MSYVDKFTSCLICEHCEGRYRYIAKNLIKLDNLYSCRYGKGYVLTEETYYCFLSGLRKMPLFIKAKIPFLYA